MATNGKPSDIDDLDDDEVKAYDEFVKRVVIPEGDKRLHAQIQEAIRLGIIDEKGNLLKHELPEDMREDSDRDFGG
jgi:hypothetical protein